MKLSLEDSLRNRVSVFDLGILLFSLLNKDTAKSNVRVCVCSYVWLLRCTLMPCLFHCVGCCCTPVYAFTSQFSIY